MSGILPTIRQPGIVDHLANAANGLAGAANGAMNAAAAALESPAIREQRERVQSTSNICVLVSIALAIGLVAIAFFELVSGASALGFCIAGMGAFLSYDFYLFFTEMSHISESPVRFQRVAPQQLDYQRELVRACAQETLLLKHIVALF